MRSSNVNIPDGGIAKFLEAIFIGAFVNFLVLFSNLFASFGYGYNDP